MLVRVSAGGIVRDLTPAPWNVRSRVHEYGGGAFAIGADAIWFCQYDDQRLYRLDASGTATALTRDAAMRYADAVLDASRRRLIAVREDHGGRLGEPVNALVAIDVDSGDERVLADGHDFFSSPCLSADGRQLAWLSWDHPNMPWDGTDLWVAPVGPDGALGAARHVAGGRAESIFQPAWSPGGELHFVSDRTGWWNLYREHAGAIEALCPIEAEFGEPQWVFGMSTYGFDGAGRIVCTYHDRGRSRLAWIDPRDATLHAIDTPFEAIRDIKVGGDFVAFFGGSPTAPEALVRLDLRHRRACADPRDQRHRRRMPTSTARAEPIAFPSAGGRLAHAYFYAPTNRDVRRPRRRAPAAARDRPRRTDRRDQLDLPLGHPVLDPARLRGRRRRLRRQHRLRPRLPRAAARRPGASSTSRTRSMRRATWSSAATSTRSASRSAGRAQAATRRWPR